MVLVADSDDVIAVRFDDVEDDDAMTYVATSDLAAGHCRYSMHGNHIIECPHLTSIRVMS